MTPSPEEAFGSVADDRSASRKNLDPDQARSRCRLSEKLERNIFNYALVASAAGVGVLAMTPPAAGSIVYTPTNQRITNNTFLDLNNDGINDFRFGTLCTDLNIRNTTVALSMAILSFGGFSGNEVWGKGFVESALPAGVKLSSKGQFSPNLYLMGDDKSGRYSGPWAPAGGSIRSRYLGLKFFINGQVHFGWARLNVKVRGAESTCVHAVLTGYAFETVPGRPILTGKTQGPDLATAAPTTLGSLALGAVGLVAWRREREVIA